MHTVYFHQRILLPRSLLRRVSGAIACTVLAAALLHSASLSARAENGARPASVATSTLSEAELVERIATVATPAAEAMLPSASRHVSLQ